ncbi:hypothetical protein Tco_0629539, partial [Tanacetum coccineum]
VAQLRTRVASIKAIESSLRGEVAFAKEHKGLLEHERSALNLKVTSLKRIVDQVRELETSFAGLREKLETYEGSMKQLEEFQDNLMKPLEARLAEIDADFTRCYMHFQDSFRPYLLNVIVGRRWLLAHGMRLLMAKCLNSSEYMEALRNAFGRAPKPFTNKINEGAIRTNESKQDQLVVGSQTLSVALDICHGRVRKMKRNLTERLPILKDVFTSIDHPPSVEALTVLPETFIEPPVATPATNVLSTVVIRPTPDSFLSVEDYENPHLADAVPGGVIPEPRGEGKVEGSNDADVGDLVLSQLEGEARDAVL